MDESGRIRVEATGLGRGRGQNKVHLHFEWEGGNAQHPLLLLIDPTSPSLCRNGPSLALFIPLCRLADWLSRDIISLPSPPALGCTRPSHPRTRPPSYAHSKASGARSDGPSPLQTQRAKGEQQTAKRRRTRRTTTSHALPSIVRRQDAPHPTRSPPSRPPRDLSEPSPPFQSTSPQLDRPPSVASDSPPPVIGQPPGQRTRRPAHLPCRLLSTMTPIARLAFVPHHQPPTRPRGELVLSNSQFLLPSVGRFLLEGTKSLLGHVGLCPKGPQPLTIHRRTWTTAFPVLLPLTPPLLKTPPVSSPSTRSPPRSPPRPSPRSRRTAPNQLSTLSQPSTCSPPVKRLNTGMCSSSLTGEGWCFG